MIINPDGHDSILSLDFSNGVKACASREKNWILPRLININNINSLFALFAEMDLVRTAVSSLGSNNYDIYSHLLFSNFFDG